MSQKKILVAGATGATGSHLVRILLEKGHSVKAIARSRTRLPQDVLKNENLEVVEASILEIPMEDLKRIVSDCDAIASCLGHNLSFKGIWGAPRKLVFHSLRNLITAIQTNQKGSKTRIILMNTSGYHNPDTDQRLPFKNKLVTGLLRILIPPHPDNEKAAEYLKCEIGETDPAVEWVAVRPDGLIDEAEVSPYKVYPTQQRNPIFNAGKTSRINVADFMARLATEVELWSEWNYKFPVIYNDL